MEDSVEGRHAVTIQKQSQEIAWAQELVARSWAYREARVLQVAHRVGIFQCLGGDRETADDVAADRGLNAGMTEKLLIVCAAMGLLDREDTGWALTPKGAATMLPDAPLYQGNAIAHSADVWGFWNNLEAAVRGEKGNATRSDGDTGRSRSHRDFILAMHNMAMAGRAAELADRVDLSGKRTLVDVGGGPGTYTIALCQRYSDLQGTIYDLPETLDITREVLDRFDMAGRIKTVPGSWEDHEFGAGYDAVLMSNVLHGPGSRAEMKLEKAHRSLNSGGLLIVQDFLLNPEKTGPLKPALFNLMVGAFSVNELTDRMAAAGFSVLHRHEMPEDLGTLLITAVRK